MMPCAPLSLILVLVACSDQRILNQTEAPTNQPLFLDMAKESGLNFDHFHGAAGDFYLAEVTAGGCAMLDYDNDGDLDLYLTQGSMLPPGRSPEEAEFTFSDDGPPRDRLFENRSDDRGLRFVDITEEVELDLRGYGMGVASGDFNNDGYVDLYLTGLQENSLLLGGPDGKFVDATVGWNAGDVRWSVPASVFDFDRDGWLDLFVGNYVDLEIDNPKQCFRVTGARDYCGPLAYTELSDRLFHNRRGEEFEDVTRSAGLNQSFGSALGSVFLDADSDGWLDLYVANDGRPNQLWMNRGDGTFDDQSLVRGAALNSEGQAEASMGVVSGDLDSDGDLDLVMAHLAGETHTLYQNDGSGNFRDATIGAGMAAASKWATGFGALALDFDNDGDLDILTANGAVQIVEEQATNGVLYPLRMRNQLFQNSGLGEFREVSDQAGPAFANLEVSRGAAAGDVDNDGDTDVLILNNNGPVELLINQVGQDQAWIGFRVVTAGADSAVRDAIGARAILHLEDQSSLVRTVHTTESFASSSDPRLLFGLGEHRTVSLTVRWVSGLVEEFDNLQLRSYQVIQEGTGRQAGS